MIVVYWLWCLGVFFTRVAPRRWSYAAAAAIGNSVYYLMPMRRRIAKQNFAHVLGKSPDDPHVRRVAREALRNYMILLRDVMIYPGMSVEELDKRVTIHSPEYLERALATGKGAIIVSAHFGNMDLAAAALAKHFKPFTLVAETLRPQQLMDYLTNIRRARGVHLFPYDRAPRKIIEALKRNEMTTFLLDFGVTHHFDIATVPVEFFGTPTRFPSGPAQLSMLTGAPIVVGYTCVAPDEHIHVYLTLPIVIERNGDRQHVFQVTMQEIAQRFESFILQHPEQWYIFRPMWLDGENS
ncbi:Kdo2-lipid IVA lauroyltransferase [Anaerolineae bacterium]|nr:Kdo2-lipid IVA lauroyltransferase [Anaerolineae bacterium]